MYIKFLNLEVIIYQRNEINMEPDPMKRRVFKIIKHYYCNKLTTKIREYYVL